MTLKMNGELFDLIDTTVKRTVSDTVAELKRNNLLSKGKQTPFQKTETLLFNYNNFKAAVADKERQVEELIEYGLRKKSNSITSFTGGDGLIDVKSEMEKLEEKIELLESSIQTTKNFIKIIDDVISMLSDDPYFDLIRLRYFEGRSRDEIADYFECDSSTVSRNKNRLINYIQIRLFSDEVIIQIFSM